MRTPTLWLLFLPLVAVLGTAPDATSALQIPDKPSLASRSIGKPRAAKRKRPRPPKRGQTVRPLGGGCTGTSVITATDELGRPFFPRSVTPVTTRSFVFTHSKRPLLSPVEAALRVLAVDEDPPMFSVATIDLRNLVLDPDAGTVLGTGAVGAVGGIVRCNIPTQPNCEVVHALPRAVFDLARLGTDDLLFITGVPGGLDSVFVLTAAGEQFPLYDPADVPGFMARSVVQRGDTVFVGGFTLTDLRAFVIAVPLDGGPIREEITFDPGLFPGELTVLGADLIVEVDAQEVMSPSAAGDAVPSRLLRVQLDAAGSAVDFQDIPVVAPGFVNVIDLESLDGQLFVVDSRLPTRGEWTDRNGNMISGRLLRICPQ